MPSLVFFGTTSLSAYILEQLAKAGYHIKAVITTPDKPVGRKQLITPTPVSEKATELGFDVLKPAKLRGEFTETNHHLLTADLFVIAAYGKIVPQELLDIPAHGTLNVHGSLLPKYRGASPIQAAILNGDAVTGPTIMLVDAEMDHGDILTTEEIAIADDETFESLEQKMAEVGANLLIKTIPGFLDGSIKPVAQDHAQATYTKLITKEDGFFEIDSPPSAEELDRMIRAYYPWPNVWTRWSPDAKAIGDANGKVIKFYPDGMIQMEGKNKVTKAEFKRGYPDFPLV